MADKKITELPFIDTLSGSLVGDNSPLQNTVIPLVLRGNTNQINIENFSKFVTAYSAHTGSAGNIFTGPQTINNNVTINGRLTVREVVAEYETASILFSTGSTKLGDEITDRHEFTGSTNITGSFIVNGANLTDFSASNSTLFTNYSSSVSESISSYSSSNSMTFTNLSSSNSTTFTNLSSSNSTTFTNLSSSNSTTFTNLSSSNSTTFTNYSSSTATTINGLSLGIGAELARVYQTTASLNVQTGSQDLVNLSISTYTGSQNVINSSVDSHILKQATQTGSQDLVNFNISTYTGSQNVINSSVDAHILKQSTQTGSQDLVNLGISSVTGSLIGITNTLMAFTAALDNTYATDAQLYQLYQATASIQAFTSSQDSRNFTISQITSSIDAHILKQATQTGSQDLVNLSISTYTGSQNVINSSVDAHILKQATQTGSQDLVNLGISSVTGSLIGITNGLMAFTAALDSTYATDAQLYQLYQATASLNTQTGSQNTINFNISVVTSSIDSHILKQATQTGSQDLVNLGISTFTGSLRSEVNLIEAYTASLKGAAIVSSSQQITNYYKFAETASANIFYGTQTISGSLNVSSSLFVSSSSTFKGNLTIEKVAPNITMKGGYTEDAAIFLNSEPSIYLTDEATATKGMKVNISTGDVSIITGNLIMGTSGKGIDFSATSNSAGTMTSELLNDYEEGTFTPTFVGTNLTIITYGNRAAFYTKVGRLVTVTINIMTESLSVSGTHDVKIAGLPFTSNSTAESSNSVNIFNSSRWTALPPICGQVGPNSTEIELHSDRGATGAGTDPTTVKTTDMAIGSGNRNMVRLTATYFV